MGDYFSEASKDPFPHVIPFLPPPPQFSPTAAYLSKLAPCSRLTMAKLLRRVVTLLGSSTAAEGFPWSRRDYATTIQLRQTLGTMGIFAPALTQQRQDQGEVFFFLAFAHRARIAFWAISRRRSGVSFSCRAFAPRRPRATAWGFFSFLSDIGIVSTLAVLLQKKQIIILTTILSA